MQYHLELENLGILRQTKVPSELTWMTELEKSFVLEMLLAGEDGLHKSYVAKVSKSNEDMVLNLTIRNLAEWLTDKHGKPASLALTWKGEEVARLLHQIAKNESKRKVKLT